MPPDLPISEEDWNHTPPAVQALVVLLWQQVQALQAEVAELRERLRQTSRNSSKPPSSDPPSMPPCPQRTPSGRKPGGQKGHRGHGRALEPPERVDRIVEVKPVSCAACGALLLGADPQPARHQVTEVPRVQPEVTEYRRHRLTCLACGVSTQTQWPAAMPSGGFGPRLQATVGYLTGRVGASQREVEEVLDTLLHTDLSLGSIPALEGEVSAALAEPVAAAQAYVQQQPVSNVDETSWRERAQRTWLWVSATPLVTVFWLLGTRGAVGAKRVLGAAFQGVVGTDRWSAYNWLAVQRRQLCWAHLKRDFQALVERGGESERIGRALLEAGAQVFGLWHALCAGQLSRADFQAATQPLRTRVGELLREGMGLAQAKTRRTCQNILKLEAALWTFVWVEGVEPTNNRAERPLRRAVLWRRRSFGTQSEGGSEFVARVLTTVTTLRQQRRDVLDYLTEACAAAIRGDKSPSLLPPPSVVNTAT